MKKNTLAKNDSVKALLQVLSDTKMETTAKDLLDMVQYVDKMENQLDAVLKELQEVKNQLNGIQETNANRGIRSGIKKAISRLEVEAAKLKQQIIGVKTMIVKQAKKAVDAFREKGVRGLNHALNLLGVKRSLQSVRKALVSLEEKADAAIGKVEQIQERSSKSSISKNIKAFQEKQGEQKNDMVSPSKNKRIEASL